MRIVDPQLPTLERFGFAMEEIHEGQVPGDYAILSIVAVKVKEIAVVAGRNLRLNRRNIESSHAKPFKHVLKHALDARDHKFIVSAQVHEHARSSMLVVHHAPV